MNILGIDYGRQKVGFAFSSGPLSEPVEVYRYTETGALTQKIKNLIDELHVNQVVVGISEGEMAKEIKAFGKNLEVSINLPVHFFDETLTTKDAEERSIEAGMSRKKRRGMEDAFAASLMLQNYLDSK